MNCQVVYCLFNENHSNKKFDESNVVVQLILRKSNGSPLISRFCADNDLEVACHAIWQFFEIIKDEKEKQDVCNRLAQNKGIFLEDYFNQERFDMTTGDKFSNDDGVCFDLSLHPCFELSVKSGRGTRGSLRFKISKDAEQGGGEEEGGEQEEVHEEKEEAAAIKNEDQFFQCICDYFKDGIFKSLNATVFRQQLHAFLENA